MLRLSKVVKNRKIKVIDVTDGKFFVQIQLQFAYRRSNRFSKKKKKKKIVDNNRNSIPYKLIYSFVSYILCKLLTVIEHNPPYALLLGVVWRLRDQQL